MTVEQPMCILVTGAQGFIGKNLVVHLGERENTEILSFTRGDDLETLRTKLEQADVVVHLAGENRPTKISDFILINKNLTSKICEIITATGRPIPLILASSRQAESDNPYGQSKRAAEQVVEAFAKDNGNPIAIYRLPGVFGKWCKPNYNSVVATFCHNIARGLPIQISDAETTLNLVYIDDVIDHFLRLIDRSMNRNYSIVAMEPHDTEPPQVSETRIGLGDSRFDTITPEYTITLGELAKQITAFQNCRTSLISEQVGTGLIRALYATYISYLPPEQFVYDLPIYRDERGVFAEMLKTPTCGQFSFFSVLSGVTRGSHYHHTKTEKFLVVQGAARLRFRQLVTNAIYEVNVLGENPQVVDTVPGWVHDITNIGTSEVIVMLWANENFDRQRPDSIPSEVEEIKDE